MDTLLCDINFLIFIHATSAALIFVARRWKIYSNQFKITYGLQQHIFPRSNVALKLKLHINL